LALKQADAVAANQRDALKTLHHMRCPKCGMELHTLDRGSVQVDACFNCKGVWLDAGELETLVAQGASSKGPSITQALLDIFRRASP
ncbi:MAG TPA: zf-TFIIB domain-containing protein, partial [Myxococcaceae bacterium]|nr:zf-TFIIB domain-containing protein [Myxococcaceae bacterium]